MNNELGFACYPCDKLLTNKRDSLDHINSKSCRLGRHQKRLCSTTLGFVCFSCEKEFISKIDAALHLAFENCSNTTKIRSFTSELNSVQNSFDKMSF